MMPCVQWDHHENFLEGTDVGGGSSLKLAESSAKPFLCRSLADPNSLVRKRCCSHSSLWVGRRRHRGLGNFLVAGGGAQLGPRAHTRSRCTPADGQRACPLPEPAGK